MFNNILQALNGRLRRDRQFPELSAIHPADIQKEFSAARQRNLPLFLDVVTALFIGYAALQYFILREKYPGTLALIALGSAAILVIMRFQAAAKRYPLGHPTQAYIIALILIWLSMYLRLIITGDPKQTANLAFFLVGIGMLLLPPNWFLLMVNGVLASWLAAYLNLPPHPDWVFYGAVIFTAMAAGVLAHIIFTRSYRHQAGLRLLAEQQREELAELSAKLGQFNQELEQKVAERTAELEAAYAQLARLDKTKSDFITIASHELRTPLTIVNFNNQILLDDEHIRSNDYYAKRVEGIHNGVMRMEAVVESMLDVAKIDTQALQLQLAPVNVPLLLRMIADQFRKPLAERRLTLTLGEMQGLPEVLADAEALQKVFHHLLVNAIKYTPDGGQIVVNGRYLNSHTPPQIEITIQDTGIGIQPEARELIFEKFYQTGEVKLHSSGQTTFKGGGPGLGLAIARGIVRAHNGRIWVESPGCNEETCPGSTFFVTLPVDREP